MEKPLWRIEGFVTAAGNRVVQKWYWDEIGIEERDALRDRMSHLANAPKHLWKEPLFEWFGDIGEVKKRVSSGALRVYGFFPDESNTFVFLLGVVKKKTKDREGMELARTRLKRLKSGEGDTHEFDFEERASPEDSPGQEGQNPIGSVEPFGGYRFPN
jgi:hypothetical protein